MNGSIAVQAWPHPLSHLGTAALEMERPCNVRLHETAVYDSAELAPILTKQIGEALHLELNGRASQ